MQATHLFIVRKPQAFQSIFFGDDAPGAKAYLWFKCYQDSPEARSFLSIENRAGRSILPMHHNSPLPGLRMQFRQLIFGLSAEMTN